MLCSIHHTAGPNAPDLPPSSANAGNLVVYKRPASYRERRTDGYQEPQLIFILGTAHVSQQSADDVTQLIEAVQPDAVVVELCKSRTGVLNAAGDFQQQQFQQQEQQQQELARHQQRWQQQWQQWQQRKDSQLTDGTPAAVTAAGSSSTTSSVEEDFLTKGQTRDSSESTVTVSRTSNQSSSSGSSAPGMWQRLRASVSAANTYRASNPLSLSGPDPVRALARSASLGGQQAMLLRLLIAGQARKAAGACWDEAGKGYRMQQCRLHFSCSTLHWF